MKSFDLNLGFNGEPSTISEVYADNVSCGASGANSFLDPLKSGFVLSSTKKSKDGGFLATTKEYVEASCQKLNSIPVLVAGISCSPFGDAPSKSMHLISPYQELPNNKLQKAKTLIEYNNGIIYLGRTFSVLNANTSFDKDGATKTLSRFYSNGQKIFQWPTDITNKDEIEALESAVPVLKYGYFLKDLKSVIEKAGYDVSNFPSGNDLILLDFGGSLKDVISSVASMFGLYWTCKNYKITFFSRDQVSAIVIKDFTTDDDVDIVSASITEEFIGKKTIASCIGSSGITINGSGGGGGASGSYVTFRLYEDIFNYDALGLLFAFFKFGGSADFFDKIVTSRIMSQVSGKEFDPLYDSSKIKKQKYVPINFEKEFQEKHPSGNFLVLKGADKPSISELFSTLGELARSLPNIYVSKGKSKSFTKRYSLIMSEGMSVTGPYVGTTLLSEIGELSSLMAIIKKVYPALGDKTIEDMSKKVHGTEFPILTGENAFFYLGTTPLDEPKEDLGIIMDHFKTLSLNFGAEYSDYKSNKMFKASDLYLSQVDNFLVSSKKYFEKLAPAKDNISIDIKAVKINADSEDSGGGESHELIYNVYQIGGDTPDDLSSINILTLGGTVDEAEYKAANWNLLAGSSTKPKSSSVTYNRLALPDIEDLSLSSCSISFSGPDITTTLTYSTKDVLSVDEGVVMGNGAVTSNRNFIRRLNPRQKNYLKVN